MWTPRGVFPGIPRGAKTGGLRLESGNLARPARVFGPFIAPPTYGGFAYLVYPRWILGDHVRPSANLVIPARVLCSPFDVTPIYGGCAYLVSPRWASVIMCGPPRNVARRPR